MRHKTDTPAGSAMCHDVIGLALGVSCVHDLRDEIPSPSARNPALVCLCRSRASCDREEHRAFFDITNAYKSTDVCTEGPHPHAGFHQHRRRGGNSSSSPNKNVFLPYAESSASPPPFLGFHTAFDTYGLSCREGEGKGSRSSRSLSHEL